ncbi:type III pantothenate kinase [Oleiharenicola lentus]|uniref:type III pantothenate kinase n=1 Tax=Oleiharenicola lentus TaxID=2508720 RepID=UPI003F675579
MLLCLDTGNTQIHGGVFQNGDLRFQFRKSTHPLGSSDELGVFFTAVLRAQGIEPAEIKQVALCSVVPAALHALRSACEKYFNGAPFVLQAGVKTGLKIKYRNPQEVGSDRIAGAIGARFLHPDRDLIVVDCGTATTFDVITASGDYLGGVIMPGVGISAEMLASKTAKLPRVEITQPESVLGRSTAESIQSGLYHGHVGAIRNLVHLLTTENFPSKPYILGTGGFARMFADAGLFEETVPELVLLGLGRAHQLNTEETV